ncbi:hypothetical protein, partial [Streptomyces sp. NPDC102360]|uniref:hypothetical protein n=1 Tax=Streptomyces sp. NPDC102360 TaxID=3366160 RepID=UPI003823B184
ITSRSRPHAAPAIIPPPQGHLVTALEFANGVLVVVLRISGRECAGVCPGRTSTGECHSLNRGWATA